MKYYIIAGEASGDVHGANLVHQIKKFDENASFRGFGGTNLRREGVNTIKDISEMSFMGFIEVLRGLFKVLQLLNLCKKDILENKPDVIILIDYPGFNLKIAKFAKKRNIKVIYYISPQIWAWHRSRVRLVKKYVDMMIPILPFEKDFYEKYGINVEYFGHPLMDELVKYKGINFENEKSHIALLPGSRKSEIKKMLPVFCETARINPQEKFIVAAMSIHQISFYEELLVDKPDNLVIEIDKTIELLVGAKVALVTSGTATLETAILHVPQVVCYRTTKTSYYLARRLSKVKFICLVNLILNRELIKELIQNKCTPLAITGEMKKLLNDKNCVEEIMKGYDELCEILNDAGASERAAKAIVENCP
ncbi:lipid-A-disaccharide synthase [Odoribacter sp. OttesenSCG-928-L07]|nr:lipid-A-disaccharide synthase [Odoribacter sp. OttesenSCG-928-L07]MDL2238666.1 lipid-A-disaccharide synthase [Bacteroidales bacterium OttesenSCG-928-L14]MDL2240301.1 lipid-A-disaccharide synthase [Bacteroidales bacterium OttesenSCG-928-K22]